MSTIDSTQSIRTSTATDLDNNDFETRFGGDQNAMIAAMMLDHAHDVQKDTRTARQTEERAIEEQESRQVQEMKDQATNILVGGCVEGLAGIAGGACSIGAGAITLNGNVTPDGALVASDQGKVSQWEGVGRIAPAAGELGSAWFKHQASDAEADATDASHQAQAATRRLDDIKDTEKDTRDLVHTAIDFYRDQVRTQGDADRAALYLRG
jgi:hypothetical protein